MDTVLAKNYALILLRYGVNLQPGQKVVINAPVDSAEFTEILCREAFAYGAGDVRIEWSSAAHAAARLQYADEQHLCHFPPSMIAKYHELIDENTAIISLVSCQSPHFQHVSPQRISALQQAKNKTFGFYSDAIMNSQVQWLVAAVATPTWAQMLFPESENPLETLWDAIFSVARVQREDPLLHWEQHLETLHRMRRVLNDLQLTALKYHSENGTDLHVGLPATHIWQGGNEKSGRVVPFAANIPTEEVFTAPHATDIQGTVYSTRPLVVYNQVVRDICLTFRDGRVIDASATEGNEALQRLLQADDGASRLGEVALIPCDSPISQIPYSFYETLIDENASCHLALGAAYPTCITDGKTMSEEELMAANINRSQIHVDFMVGSNDMQIIGHTRSGAAVPIFQNGRWSELMQQRAAAIDVTPAE